MTAIRVRVGRKLVAMDRATIGQLEIAALKAFASSPYQLAIRAEIDRRRKERRVKVGDTIRLEGLGAVKLVAYHGAGTIDVKKGTKHFRVTGLNIRNAPK